MGAVGLFAALLIASCGFPQPKDVPPDGLAGPPTRIVLVAGAGQSGQAGSVLAAPLVVTVEDSAGRPVPEVAVEFVVTAGNGELSAVSATTNEIGRAETTLTLGVSPGPNAVEARVAGLASVTFTAIGVVGSATRIVITSGEGQTGTAGSALAAPLVVTVEDAVENPLSGYTVSFVVTGGGGDVSTASIATDSQGRAQTMWTLGGIAGANTAEARVTALSSVMFTATGVPGAATQVLLTSGNNQTATVGSELAAPFVVTVMDENENLVSGVTVDFVVTTGGGSLSADSVTTNAQGQAQTTLTLGTTAGTRTVEARAPGLSGSPVVFTATATPGPATDLVLTSGNRQLGAPATMLAAPLVVTAKDANDNPVPGTSVSFVVTGGGGTISSSPVATDAQGRAQTTWTTGMSGGNTVEALAPGLSGSPVVFSSTTFAPRVNFSVGSGSTSVAIGDFNRDGKPDLVVANNSSFNVSVLLNTTTAGATTPTFATKGDYSTGTSPECVAVGDFNGDGNPDLVAVSQASTYPVPVFLNTTAMGATTPSFAAKVDFTANSFPYFVAVDDLNGDGKPDLAVANTGGTVSVLLNTTVTGAVTPSFTTKVDFTVGQTSRALAIGDINGDGKPDLAVANNGSNTVSVLLNTMATGAASPSFAAKVDFSTSTGPSAVAVGDLNGDGRPDLAVTNLNSNTVSVLFSTTTTGATTPSFAAKVDLPVGTNPASVTISDLNGDGTPDLAIAHQNGVPVSVLANTTVAGATIPSFAARVDLGGAATTAKSIAVGDINGDGKPDIAIANLVPGTTSVLLAQ